MAGVNAELLRRAWRHAQVLMFLLATAAVAGSVGQGEPALALLIVGTLTLAVTFLRGSCRGGCAGERPPAGVDRRGGQDLAGRGARSAWPGAPAGAGDAHVRALSCRRRARTPRVPVRPTAQEFTVPVLDTVLAPLEIVISRVLVAAHAGLTGVGLPAASGVTWAASIAVLVVAVRLALLPLAVRQIRSARRLATVAPALAEIRERYRGRRDPDSLARMRADAARVYAEAGASPLGWLPLLLQAPVLLALFRVLDAAARGQAVGALGSSLVAQLDGATLAGASLVQTLHAGGPASLVALALSAVMAARRG
jgi:YidC/Oxa1 family membrane protein insertase